MDDNYNNDYDKQVEIIRVYNQPIFDAFQAWLEESGLARKTIKNHVDNIDFFTDFIDLSKDLQKQATQAHAELAESPITPRGNTIKKLNVH